MTLLPIRVLYVHADRLMRHSVCQMLRQRAIRCVEVDDVEEALDSASEHDWDLVVLCVPPDQIGVNVLLDRLEESTGARVLVVGRPSGGSRDLHGDERIAGVTGHYDFMGLSQTVTEALERRTRAA